jgi:hypothetical protein
MDRFLSELVLSEKKTRLVLMSHAPSLTDCQPCHYYCTIRLTACREKTITVHKQSLLKLRRHLSEQDKKFQQAQLDLQARQAECKCMQTSLEKELDTLQQSLTVKKKILDQAKNEREAKIAQEKRAKISQQTVRFAESTTNVPTEGTDRAVFVVPDARRRKHPPAVGLHRDAIMIAPIVPGRTVATPCPSSASVASDNTSLFWSDAVIAPVHEADKRIPLRATAPVDTLLSQVQLLSGSQRDTQQMREPKSKPKMRGFIK